MRIVGVSCDDPIFRPVHDRRFVDAEASCRFRSRQHTAAAKSIVSRGKQVSMDEIGDAEGGKSSAAASRSGRSAGAKSLLIKYVGDFGIDMVVEEFVHELDDHRGRLHLLSGWLGIRRRQSFCLASLEANMDFRDSFRRQLDQGGIFDDAGKQSFSFTVHGSWITPELVEVSCHREEPLLKGIIQEELVFLPGAFALLSRLGQDSQFVVPFALEGVGD